MCQALGQFVRGSDLESLGALDRASHLIEGGDIAQGKDLKLEAACVLVPFCVRLCALCIFLLFLQRHGSVMRRVRVKSTGVDALHILEFRLHDTGCSLVLTHAALLMWICKARQVYNISCWAAPSRTYGAYHVLKCCMPARRASS